MSVQIKTVHPTQLIKINPYQAKLLQNVHIQVTLKIVYKISERI